MVVIFSYINSQPIQVDFCDFVGDEVMNGLQAFLRPFLVPRLRLILFLLHEGLSLYSSGSLCSHLDGSVAIFGMFYFLASKIFCESPVETVAVLT